jgi:hypothetical protein
MSFFSRFLDWIKDTVRLASGRKFRILAVLLVIVFVFYLPIGMLWVHHISDDTKRELGAPVASQASRAVAISAELIRTEVRDNHWTPSDPVFLPGAWLDRMPSFQRGMVDAISRFATELYDQLGRSRGSSEADTDLKQAASLLKSNPDIWLFDFSTSILPTTPSKTKYLSAAKYLMRYNERLAGGDANFERRADNLMGTIDRIASDMGNSSALLTRQIEEGKRKLIDTEADELFYEVKGRMYAYYMILRELGKDFETIIASRGMQKDWEQLLDSLREGAELSPFFVMNSDADSYFANHLTLQGFYLLRARTQLREVSNILLK